MYKKPVVSIPTVKNRCLPTIGQLIRQNQWLLINTKTAVATSDLNGLGLTPVFKNMLLHISFTK